MLLVGRCDKDQCTNQFTVLYYTVLYCTVLHYRCDKDQCTAANHCHCSGEEVVVPLAQRPQVTSDQ